ncbi:hypothetical protein [Allocoleopsis sp.]|uniref:hypothetical protein n=1 Tax=Allocoleopsis sp. TaxID=3088169 RepID=UPI002FCF8217
MPKSLVELPSQPTLITQQEEHLMAEMTTQTQDKELHAYQTSKYNYWDARVLADYWGQSEGEAFLRKIQVLCIAPGTNALPQH